METGKQKSCVICGVSKPLSAFHSNNGNISTICLNCLKDNSDGEEGGGGLGVDIVDKLTAVKLAEEKEKAAVAEHFEVVTKRLDTEIKSSHEQDNPNNRKSNGGLFGNRGTEKHGQTTGNKAAATNPTTVASNKKSLFGTPPQQDSKMDQLATDFLKTISRRNSGRR